jgi:Zn-dependent protease with chaperone function
VTYLLEILVVAAIAVPHVLRLDVAPPGLSALIWLAALMLRAMAVVFAAILVVLYVPTTALFDMLTHSHWEIGVPAVGWELSFDGHVPGALALALPALLLAASLLWAVAGLWRSSRRVARLLRATVGPGPDGSLVLADRDVLIAAAGVRRPCIVVSAGALLLLDDAELAASLEHERGHIARRHRYVLLLGELCGALARPLPGTRAAGRELLFHVERDADQYAIRGHDPTVLASAICKAAQANALGPAVAALGGGVVSRRVRQLLELPPRSRATHKIPLQALAAAMVTLAMLSASSLPSAAHTSYHEAGHASAIHN